MSQKAAEVIANLLSWIILLLLVIILILLEPHLIGLRETIKTFVVAIPDFFENFFQTHVVEIILEIVWAIIGVPYMLLVFFILGLMLWAFLLYPIYALICCGLSKLGICQPRNACKWIDKVCPDTENNSPNL